MHQNPVGCKRKEMVMRRMKTRDLEAIQAVLDDVEMWMKNYRYAQFYVPSGDDRRAILPLLPEWLYKDVQFARGIVDRVLIR